MAGLVERWIATRAGFKPRDVEEPIDYYWHRPLAGLLVQLLAPTPITPNRVTLASAAVSLVAGVSMGLGSRYGRWWMFAGGLLLLLSVVLDCADGQLARVRGTASPIGRILDGVMDAVAPLAVYHGMALYLLAQGYSAAWIWPVGLASGASLLWHASEYDVSKNVYLHASRPDFSLGGSTLLTPDQMRSWQKEFEQQGQRAYAWLMGIWVHWTKPQLRALEPWLDPQRSPGDETEREIYRSFYRQPMRALSWQGFGTHLFLLTSAALLAPWDVRAIWVAWLIMLGPLNVLCAWVVLTRKGREARYLAALERHRSARSETERDGDSNQLEA